MIKFENVTRLFRSGDIEIGALQEVSFEIGAGEFVAVMGPSGCGKSTLLNIIGLLDNPTSGRSFFEGQEVSKFNENQRALLRKGNIGFIFQNFNLVDRLNVFENIELPLLALKMSKKERRDTVCEMAEKLKIGHRLWQFPNELSGGHQQRVAIARALITHPKLLLADEPTGNLDSANGEIVMQLLEQRNMEGTTVVMVSHSLHHADRVHRVINLFDGHIVAEYRDFKNY